MWGGLKGGGMSRGGGRGPAAGRISIEEALASKPSRPPGGRKNTMCRKRLQWIFLSPHLTLSTQSPPVCGLWGGCTGAAYPSDRKERRREKIPSNGRALNPLLASKDPRTQHTQAGFETASHDRHGDTETNVCVQRHACAQTHVQTQRRLSRVPTRTCSTEAKDTGPCRQKGLEVPTQAQRDTVPRGFTQDGASRTCTEARVRVFLDTHPTARSALLTLGRWEPASPLGSPVRHLLSASRCPGRGGESSHTLRTVKVMRCK